MDIFQPQWNYNATLRPANFGENGISVLSSMSDRNVAYQLQAGDYSGKTFVGGTGSDVIYVENGAENINVNSGGGNDYVYNSANNAQISLGAGNDNIENTGNYAVIEGGEGNDQITISGENSFIYGGAGNNRINVYGENSRVYLFEGNNTVQVGVDVTKIYVEGFGVGDEINFGSDAITSLETSGENLIAHVGERQVTISGVSQISKTESGGWFMKESVDDAGETVTLNSAVYSQYVDKSGACIEDNAIR